MSNFCFQLEFSLPASCWNLDDILDKVWAASAPSMTSGLASPGRILLDFSVEAMTLAQAVAITVSQVSAAVSVAKFIPKPQSTEPPICAAN